MEILVLSDCSTGRDSSGQTCKQIVKTFAKSLKKAKIKVPVSYLENRENKGTNETRRNLVYEAKGEYIFMLDSDDQIVPEGMLQLLKTANETSTSKNYDILNGNFKDSESFWNCEFSNREIFNNFMVSHNIPGFLWTKLIKRELYLEAYDKIPPTYCNFGEDFMVMFFITWNAKTYYSTDTVIYDYNRDAGITSRTKIDTLARWEKVCSTASCFSILYLWIDEQIASTGTSPLTKEEYDALAQFAVRNVSLNLNQLYQMVEPEIFDEARAMLGEYWGEKLVQSVETQKLNSHTSGSTS